jgi:hypothetical protein
MKRGTGGTGGTGWRVGLAVALAVAAARTASATETKIFRLQSPGAFAEGTFEGVSLDAEGRLRLGEPIEKLAGIEEPFLFALARRGDGLVAGTGNSGKVLAIDARGTVTELFATVEPDVFALWVDADGTVLAGSSPHGKVYRWNGAKAEVFFDPHETYIWAIARAANGELLVATGTAGKLYAVSAQGRGAVLYDSDATHLRSLLPVPGGRLLAGSANDGRVIEIAGDGKARTLYDSALAEVVALADEGKRGVVVAVLDSEAGFVESAALAKPEGEAGAGAGAAAGAAAATTPGAKAAVEGSAKIEEISPARKAGAPRSEIVRLLPDGRFETLRTFANDTVFSIAVREDRLWIGTGLDGKLFGLRDDLLVLEKDLEDRQVVAILPLGGGLAFGTTNGAAIYRSTGAAGGLAGLETRGTYTSAVLDALQVSRFGALRWRGSLPPGTALRWSARAGNSAEPDSTWSEWTAWQQGTGAAGDGEWQLSGLPATRYLQWRAEFSGAGSSPELTEVEASYRARNAPPRIKRFQGLDPGEVLVLANFNPSAQVFEPMHPDKSGIFTTLANLPGDGADARFKTLWKKGYRTLRWEVDDANQDRLEYRLWFRPESDTRSGARAAWLPMTEDVTDTHFEFDETALPDGVYRFRIEASDAGANAAGEGLTDEKISDPMTIDSTAPRKLAVRGAANGELTIEVTDALNPLRSAEWSVDAGEWSPAAAQDGVLDGRREMLVVPRPPQGAAYLVLRVMDASFNVAAFDLSGEVRP